MVSQVSPGIGKHMACRKLRARKGRRRFCIAYREQLKRLEAVLDPNEFLSDYGVRGLSGA